MSDVIYEQPVIRAQLSILSNPPVAPIDINTGVAPQFWRASGIAIQTGLFNGANVGVDLSNLSYLQLTLQPTPLSKVPWVVKQVLAVDIESPIEYGDWINGLTQNAEFVLSPAETDLGLLAGESRQFWMEITGFTLSGNFITYGAGYVTIYNPGNTLPPPQPGVVSYHKQTSTAGDFTITPEALIHTEKVTFHGDAGTRNVVLEAAGFQEGSIVRLIALFPDLTPGIIINVYSNSLTGDPIFQYTTDQYQPNAFMEATVNEAAAYEASELTSPAFPS